MSSSFPTRDGAVVQASSPRTSKAKAWTLVLLAAMVSCRHKRGRGGVPRGEVVVMRAGAVDAEATTLARSIDARLDGACPRRIVITGKPEPRALAETCVRTFAHLSGADRFQRAQPFSTGLVEVAALAATADEAETVTLRSLARLAFSRGLLVDTALRASSTRPPFQDIEEAPAMELDPDTRRAIAFVIVDHLVSHDGVGHDGVGARAILSLAARTARDGVDAALERPPFHTDVETLFSIVRALALSFQPPRAPALSTVELRSDDGLFAQFDAKLRTSPLSLLVCGERYQGVLTAAGDAFTVSFDRARCLDVDGAHLVSIEVGGLSTSPRGLDGAIGRRTFARAESPPSLAGQ